MLSKTRVFIGGLAIAIVGLVGFSVPAIASHGGGDSSGPTLNDVVVNKVVLGDVPPLTEFKVYVDCVRAAGGEGEETTTTATTATGTGSVVGQSHGNPGADVPGKQLTEAEILFGSDGTPKTLNNITVGPGPVDCQVTETLTGAASSVTYACAITDPGQGGEVGAAAAGCALGGEAPVTVSFIKGTRDAVATVTVTNTFPTQPPPQPEAAAAEVILQPRFTG